MSVSGEMRCARRGVPPEGTRRAVPVRPAVAPMLLEVPVTRPAAVILSALTIVLLLGEAGGL